MKLTDCKQLFVALIGALVLMATPGLSQEGPNDDDPQDVDLLLSLAESFLESPNSGIYSGPDDHFENAAATLDSDGNLIARYQRFHRGLRVLGASVKLTAEMNGEVQFHQEPESFKTPDRFDPLVTESEAWEIAGAEMRVEPEGIHGDLELALYPQSEQEPATLVWRVHAFHREGEPVKLYVDAMTGEVVWRQRGIVEESVNVTGIGYMRPRGSDAWPEEVEIDTLWHNHDDTYYLVDHSRGGTKVLDMRDGVKTDEFQGADYMLEGDNEWGNGEDWVPGDPTDGAIGQTAAVEALWGSQRTWDMLLDVLGHEGLDGKGAPMLSRVHFREDAAELYKDAHWDGTHANLGDGETPAHGSRTDLSTVAHEFGHGVWHHMVSDDNEGEARGLNEGHGDIAATAVLHHTRIAGGVGPVLPTPERGDLTYFPKRMVNPWSYHATGCAHGLAAYVNGMADIEEHCQGTAYGHMFAILSMGVPAQVEVDAEPCAGKSYTCLGKSNFPLGLTGIGIDKATRIWYRATVKYFDDDPTFSEARDAWLAAADELFGNPSAEHSAVMNAFYLINVGGPAEDVFPPEVSPQPVIVDNYEGSILLDATALDDIGVVAMDGSSGVDGKRMYGNRFKGYLKAPTLPGPYQAKIRAWDAAETWSEAILPYDYQSSNRLFLSGFEQSKLIVDDAAGTQQWVFDGQWTASRGSILIEDAADGAFLGEGYLSFAGNDTVERSVTIPAEATEVHLGYRYRVKPGLAAGFGQLRVEIFDDEGQFLEIAQLITTGDDTSQWFSNDYLKNTYVLSSPYAGETLTVRISSLGSEADAFRVDQAFMVWFGNPDVDLTVDVDEREGSVIFEAEVSGISRARVAYVSFEVDGVPIADDAYWPYQLIRPTSNFAEDVQLGIEAIAYDHFGNEITSSGADSFEVESVTQAIFNGDFETGDAYWNPVNNVAYCTYNPAGAESHPSFLGSGCMAFDGPAHLSRTFWMPANALTASLSFRLRNESPAGSDAVMTFHVINNDTGQTMSSLPLLGELEDTDAGVSHKGYRKYVIDMTPYIGTDFSIEFETQSNGGPLQYFLDNVGATYYLFGGPPGGGGPGGVAGG